MALPKVDSLEWQREKEEYVISTIEWRRQRAKELGYSCTNNYVSMMNKRGIRLRPTKTPPSQTEPIIEHIPYPDLKIKPFKPISKQRDEEDIGIVLSDHHVGRETANYNPVVYKTRMDFLLDSTMTIINLHRPIRKAYVFALGDMVHGESIYKGGHIEECKVGAYGQIHEHAVPVLSEFLASLA